MLVSLSQAEDEEEDDEDETEEDARDRLSNDLAEVYDNDTNRLSAVTETLEETLIPHHEVSLLHVYSTFDYFLRERT